MSGSLEKVSIPIWLAISSNVGDLLVSVQTVDNSGFPSGTIVGSGSVPAGNFVVGAPAGWVDIVLAGPAPVSSGTKYALVLSTANAPGTALTTTGVPASTIPIPAATGWAATRAGGGLSAR
jgi:hypothetical protein